MHILILGLLSTWLTNFYDLQFTDTDGNTVNMSSYQNKKILLVNIATGSPKVGQLAGLQQLQQTYGDSLVIIVFPSNSFGNETRTDAGIKEFCQNNYSATFKIAAKNAVTGAGAQSVYYWISHASQNGVMDAVMAKDFQKFLIGKDGTLTGVFGSALDPMSPEIVNAITQ